MGVLTPIFIGTECANVSKSVRVCVGAYVRTYTFCRHVIGFRSYTNIVYTDKHDSTEYRAPNPRKQWSQDAGAQILVLDLLYVSIVLVGIGSQRP